MNLDLDGKRALVTGSSSGLGEAIAKALAAEGAAVVVHGRRQGEVERVRDEISNAGGRAIETTLALYVSFHKSAAFGSNRSPSGAAPALLTRMSTPPMAPSA
ncbi:MAG: SDR family NAD(P)-dependent oxidoreductase, partial [Pseudomonadota bacterium]